MSKKKKFRRAVVSMDFLPSQFQWGKWQGSNIFKLECGHTQGAKQSQGEPMFKFCHTCECLAKGSIYYTEIENGWIKETWDSETQMPHREIVSNE